MEKVPYINEEDREKIIEKKYSERKVLTEDIISNEGNFLIFGDKIETTNLISLIQLLIKKNIIKETDL